MASSCRPVMGRRPSCGQAACRRQLPARPITLADLAALTEKVRRRVVRWFRMQRLLDADAAAGSLASATCCPDTRRPTGSARGAGRRPRGRALTASSNSRRVTSWTGWPISCRHPCLPPAGHPPTGASSFRPTFDGAIIQATDRRTARDRHSQPLTGSHVTVRTAREKSGFKAGLRRPEKSGLECGQEAPRRLHGRAAYGPTSSGGCSS
jgi:hypothetical protein